MQLKVGLWLKRALSVVFDFLLLFSLNFSHMVPFLPLLMIFVQSPEASSRVEVAALRHGSIQCACSIEVILNALLRCVRYVRMEGVLAVLLLAAPVPLSKPLSV